MSGDKPGFLSSNGAPFTINLAWIEPLRTMESLKGTEHQEIGPDFVNAVTMPPTANPLPDPKQLRFLKQNLTLRALSEYWPAYLKLLQEQQEVLGRA
jgi:hypothetical protein